MTAPGPEAAAERRGSFLGSGRLAAALLVLVFLAATTCGWALRRDQPGPALQGPVTSTTARMTGMAAASRLGQRALSYRWRSLDADVRAAEAGMTAGFREQYAAAMAKVRARTLANQVTLRARVMATSVISASRHQVRALLFVNQVTTTRSSAVGRVDQNRVVVTLTRGAGDWQISQMRAF